MANTSGSSQYDKITDVPTNVKEAIDWLLRIGEWDNKRGGQPKNASAIQEAIKALTGSTSNTFQSVIQTLISDLSKFIGYKNGNSYNGEGIIKNNGTGYQSAYQNTVTWPTCRQGSKCSCCQGSSCNCTVTSKPGASSCNGQCCNTCDIRICAGIFVALVPALETALRELRDKCNESNNRQQNITSEGLKGYFTALGFDGEQLNNALKGSHVNSKLMSAISKLSTIKSRISDAFKNTGRSTQNGFTAPTTAVAPSSASITTPKTVREMLLWLMGLPYCEGYGEFVKKLKTDPYKSIVSSSTGKSKDDHYLHRQLSAVIFHLPTVFYSVEGNISYLNEVFDQFNDKAKPRFCYPNGQDGTDMLNTLSAYVAVCYPILKYLMQRCDKVNSGRGKRAIGGTTSTPTDEKDGAWGELMVSGEKNNDAQKEPKVASTAAPSSAPKTALRDYLVFMGFKTPTGTVTGDNLYEKALKECFSESMKDDEDDEKDVGATGRGPVLGRIGGRTSSKNYQKLPALRKLAKKVLQDLYKASNGGGGGSSSNGTTPTTIRQMMLWLIGLPLTTAYKSSGTSPPGPAAGTGALFGTDGVVVTEINQNQALMKLEQPSVTRGRTVSAANGKHFKQQLKDSIVGMIMLFQRIEGGLGSVLDFLKGGFIDKSGGAKDKFKYDGSTNGKTIFTEFNAYVYKVHVQLRFLMVMCKTGKNDGGWQECEFESDGGSLFQGITCSCSNSFLGSSCPTPLRHYLNGNGKNKFTNGENIPSMCFNMKYLKTDKRLTGASITPYLEALLEDIPTPTPQSQSSPKPLSLLTQYCVAIGPLEPQSLGDHFDVFRELANGMWDKIKGTVKESLRGITTSDNNGQTASEKLKTALKEVWPGSHTKHDGTDLRSLTGCNDTQKCNPFVASLSHGLYKYFDPQPLRSPANKIDWLYMKMSGLYGKLTHLHKSMKNECQCCKDKDSSSSSSCKGITQCPNCLPQLYKMGLVFGSAETLTTGKSGAKKCSELMEKMKKVLDATSKLCVIFTSIEPGRFKPYLLFASSVVEKNKEKFSKGTDGDDNYNCYTYALGGMYEDTYLDGKKKEDKSAAETKKTEREGALKCACDSHEYNAPKPGPGTPTTVTLTLYFKSTHITQTISLTVPFHGPTYNPLVRFYPRNLKSIVDWLLRIGQTRLGQDGSGASTNDTGLKEMCDNLWPKIQECLNAKDQDVFKALVKKVMNMMGLKNQGKQEVGEEVTEAYNKAKQNIQKKLNGGNGEEGFQQTFKSILTFKPKEYIDKVIDDFGKRVCTVKEASGSSKQRDFNCIAKAVNKCMTEALQKIKELVKKNKNEMDKYGITDIEDLKDVNIESVNELTSIENLKTLCEGFQKFYDVYEKVTGAFNDHLNTAQNNGGRTHWDQINKCVDAFNELGKCVQELGELNGMSSHDKMQEASMKLEKISDKLKGVHDKLNGDDIQTFTEKVTEFIKQLDDVLKKEGEKALEKALESALNINNGSQKQFSELLKSYVSTLIAQLKKQSDDNKVCDIHLRVRNDLQQLSECLKVMCEVCGTGMKDFANELKECVDKGKDHLDGIKDVKTKLQELKNNLGDMNGKDKQEQMSQLSNCISTIEQLLKNEYIYNPPPILNKLITEHDKMTKYLKQLPDLIRDRYVLQKWQDSPEVFCGVQRFEGGIVKNSDTEEIKKKLKELLKEDFNKNNDTQFSITIHEFQVRALIYNFCHKEGIKGIGEGLDVMESVKKALENVNQNPPKPQGDVDWNNIKTNKDKLSPLLKNLSDNAYLRYFATHLRDSIGYHTLSNTLGALEQVKAALEKNPSSQQPNGWDKIKDLLKKDAMKQLHDRLDALVKQLYNEYIFEYPPFDWQKSCQRLVEQNKGSRARRAAAAPSSSPTPSNTCSMCVPSMAQIFIGFVPQMYRLFKMLREMADKKKDVNDGLMVYNNNGTDAKTTTMSSLAGILLREGWRLKDGSDDDDEAFDLDDKKKGTDIYTKIDAIIGDKEPGVLLAQRENNVSTTDLQPLDKLFKAVMQHFKEKRDEKIKKRIQELKTRFEADPNNKGIPFLAPPPVLPSTVRQVLFWLHEMDTKGEFYNAMSQHINTLCERSNIKSGISQDTILHVLKLSITQCLEVLATIEDPGRQNAQYYYELYTEEHYYAYQTVNIPLFFYTFVEKLMGAFLELNFVCVQCEFTGKQGGWKDCHIGEVYNKAYDISGGTSCICHERKLAGPPMLRVEVEGSLVCPKPLSAFLFSDQKNQLKVPMDPTLRLPYMSKGTMPCGFKLKNKAITDAATRSAAQSAPTPTPAPTSVSGSVLVEPLRKLVGGHVTGRHTNTSTRKDENNTLSTVIYLRDLLRYTLCLAVRPPWSMSENMAFFYRVTESWKNKAVGSVTVAHHNPTLLKSIHNEINLFPGTFDGKQLTSAVERFAGIEDNHDKANSTHSNTSHQYDLRTLMGCQEKTTTGTSAATATALCSPFMFPLSLDVYTHYDEKNSRAYLSWILNFAFGIYGQLRGLEEMMSEKECVRNASKRMSSSCPSLPTCPGVLSALYQSGSSFMDQGKLADKQTTKTVSATTTNKTCAQFHTVLQGLFNCDSTYCTPLHNLIVQCEAFLWSIRMPFSLVQLSLWSMAILFISYVFVVPLDHFKIKSHLFNRLKYTMHPSLLIADQQRRVSEVAYFSL